MDWNFIYQKILMEKNISKVRDELVCYYNSENGTNYIFENMTIDEKLDVKRYLMKNHGRDLTMFYFKTGNKWYFSLSEKYSLLSQIHCPYCGHGSTGSPNCTIPIKGRLFSSQYKSKRRNEAIEALKKEMDVLSAWINYMSKGDKICLLLVFSLAKQSKDKDIDNMAKIILDVLKKRLFNDDIDIHHMNCFKVFNETDSDKVHIHISKSEINENKDTIFPFDDGIYKYVSMLDH